MNDRNGTINQHRTPSIDNKDSSDRSSLFCCFCCISNSRINNIVLYDHKINGINHNITAKDTMTLQSVQSTSNQINSPNMNIDLDFNEDDDHDGLKQQIAMTKITPSKNKKIKSLKSKNGHDDYEFNDIETNDIDDDEDEIEYIDNNLDSIKINMNDDYFDNKPPKEIMAQISNEHNDDDDLSPIGGATNVSSMDLGEDEKIHFKQQQEALTINTTSGADSGGGMTTTTYTPTPDAIVPIKPAANNDGAISPHHVNNVNDDFLAVIKLIETNLGLQLFMKHCAKEFCLENILAMIEIIQFQHYCKKQEKFIFEQVNLRRSKAKERTHKKKKKILKVKKRKNEQLRKKQNIESIGYNDNNKNETIKFTNNLRNKKHSSSRQRRKRKRKKSRKNRKKNKNNNNDDDDVDDTDDDDLILQQIANKPPIDIKVSKEMMMRNDYNDDINDFDDDDEEKKEGDSISGDYDTIEYEGDDDDEDFDLKLNNIYNNNKLYNISLPIDDLPESNIVNKAYIINSKNKRIEQLEVIIINLCKKYIVYGSEFSLNLPKHLISDTISKINKMEKNHNLRKKQKRKISTNMTTPKRSNLNINNNDSFNFDDNDDFDDYSSSNNGPPTNKPQLTMTESNASNWYPQNHEQILPSFFDDIIEFILRLMTDSFHRFKLTKEYDEWCNHQNLP